MFSDSVLLYPQTFLFPLKLVKVCKFFPQIILLKLPTSENKVHFWEKNQLINQIKYLEVKRLTEKEKEELKREIKLLQEWGLNFRTPETLKYLMQFKKVTEDSLEEYLSIFKKKQEEDRNFKELQKIKSALILLSLAEELDASLYDVELSLKEVEKSFSEIFEEKIIGEDLTFEKLLAFKNSSEDISFSEGLFNLELRILAWNILIPYLSWEEVPFLKALLITESTLIENWKESFEVLEEFPLNSEIIFYNFKSSLSELLCFPKDLISFPSKETLIYFVR